jgi:L-2,4-diaminobutyrate decarboxylase
MASEDSTGICSGATPEEVAADLEPLVDFADEGLSLEELSALLETKLFPHLMHYDRPSFQSMFNSFLEDGAHLGARAALDYNQGVTNWQVSPGGAVLEELSCRALCRLFGLGAEADATFMYSGTYANHQALYMALHRKAEERGFDLAQEGLAGFENPSRLVVVVSVDAHFSLRHAVRTLGLGEKSLRCLRVDGHRRLEIEALREALEEPRDVVAVVATSGTTSTGAVDPIAAMADICEEAGVWLHVDGAYGLAYKLVPEWNHLFDGVERADSVSWDPHKQFGVPIPSSLLFARRAEDFGRMALFSSYFNRPDAREPNPGIKSMPSTRPLTALSLVTSIRHQGLCGVRERLRAPLEAVRRLSETMKGEDDIELCHDPDTGILCFRIVPDGIPESELDGLQQSIYTRIMAEGRRTISLTQMDGRTVLRLVAISPAVTFESMKETVAEVRRIAGSRRPLADN